MSDNLCMKREVCQKKKKRKTLKEKEMRIERGDRKKIIM